MKYSCHVDDPQEAPDKKDAKKNIALVLDEVSKKPGNTRTVCRKYYGYLGLIQLYEENKLACMGKNGNKSATVNGLTVEENNLMKLLKKALKKTYSPLLLFIHSPKTQSSKGFQTILIIVTEIKQRRITRLYTLWHLYLNIF